MDATCVSLLFYVIMLVGTHPTPAKPTDGPPRAPKAAHGTHRCADLPFGLYLFRLFRRLALSLSPPFAGAGHCGIGKLHNFVFLDLLKKTRFDSQEQGFRVEALQKIEKVQFWSGPTSTPLLPHVYWMPLWFVRFLRVVLVFRS